MRVLKRPAKPATWEATVKQARKDIDDDVRNGRLPNFTDETKQHWRWFKKDLKDAESQILQCAYCERCLDVDRYRGDVEHYRPKAAATDRNFYTKRNGERVRRSKNPCKPGYYWLAYEWTNLLVACSECNKRKANFFPVVSTTPRRAVPRGCEKNEKPLLLNPYDDKHPENHLKFGKFGDVSAKGSGIDKDRGHETIEICDLDRDELRKERIRIATRALDDARELLAAINAGRTDVAAPLVRGLRQAMKADSAFAGMVRIIFYQVTKQHWTSL